MSIFFNQQRITSMKASEAREISDNNADRKAIVVEMLKHVHKHILACAVNGLRKSIAPLNDCDWITDNSCTGLDIQSVYSALEQEGYVVISNPETGIVTVSW
jgi:hypothetical protein